MRSGYAFLYQITSSTSATVVIDGCNTAVKLRESADPLAPRRETIQGRRTCAGLSFGGRVLDVMAERGR